MAKALSTLALLVTTLWQVSSYGQDESESALSLKIVTGKDDSGIPVIPHGGAFSVVIGNDSAKPIRIWSERCRQGYYSLTLQVQDETGRTWSMFRDQKHSSNWKNKPSKSITIPPGRSHSWEVAPCSIWGSLVWRGVPEPNSGELFTLRAVFEIKATPEVKQHDVWTGRMVGEPIKAKVVNRELETPHEYLFYRCPKQALKVMKADHSWIHKRDQDRETPLHVAATGDFTDVAKWLITNGADVNATAYNNFTPLHFAKTPEMVELLLEHGADVEARSVPKTALQRAAGRYAHLQQRGEYAAELDRLRRIMRALVKNGAEFDLLSACYLGNVQRVKALAKQRVHARDKDAMRAAATYGKTDVVKVLLDHGADPEDAGYGGLTVSYFAIEHANVLKLLFAAGADPKVSVHYEGNGVGPQRSTLLHQAASKGHIDSANLLVKQGVPINAFDGAGNTPLHWACFQGHASMVRWLLDKGANGTIRSKNGWTPMAFAADRIRPKQPDDNKRCRNVIHALQDAGIELDLFAAIATGDQEKVAAIVKATPQQASSKNAEGLPALHRAVTLNQVKVVELLLNHGCDPDIRSKSRSTGWGETALLDAAFWGRLEVAKILIRHGADVKAAEKGGATPLHEAARMRHAEFARLLLDNGADVNAKDDEEKTPLDWAHLYGNPLPEIVTLLRSHGGNRRSTPDTVNPRESAENALDELFNEDR